MSFTSFRNDYLTEAEARLSLVNVAAATTNELLINGALYKMAGAVAQIDLLNSEALRLLESMSGAQLQTYLTDASNRAAFEGILASSTAMNAVFNSLTAKAAVWASDAAVGAIAASTVAYDWLVANKAVTSVATDVSATPGTLIGATHRRWLENACCGGSGVWSASWFCMVFMSKDDMPG